MHFFPASWPRALGMGVIVFFFAASNLLALQAKKIDSRGTIFLDDNRKISLAGIELSPDFFSILSIILAGRDISFQKDAVLPASESGVIPGYVTVDTSEIDLPFEPNVQHKRHVMINEFLISLGIAKVATALDFKRKVSFLELEQSAKERGSGLWSYENPIQK